MSTETNTDQTNEDGVAGDKSDVPQDGKGRVEYYTHEIGAYQKNTATKRFVEDGIKAIQAYKNARDVGDAVYAGSVRYNIHWSSIQTAQPALYARTPKPVVEKKIKSEDPAGRLASEVLQRCCAFQISDQPFDEVMKGCRDDYLLPGRACAWGRYAKKEIDGKIAYEMTPIDYIFWQDFGYAMVRNWQEVPFVWKRFYLNKDEVTAQFGKDVAKGLDYSSLPVEIDSKKISAGARQYFSRAALYEVWDKTKREITVLQIGKADPLAIKKDELKLHNFYPCPRPLFATLTTDSMIPVSDWTIARDIIQDLDTVCHRISILTEACRVAGVTDQEGFDTLQQLFSASETTLVSVPSFRAFKERGGTAGMIEYLPLREIAETLGRLYEAKSQLENDYYKLTGYSDLVRGAASPHETAAASQIKSQFVNLRFSERQQEMQRFAADSIAIMGEIIAEHFSDETIFNMAEVGLMSEENKQLFPQALELLRNDVMRNFRIFIETDSTIAMDDQIEKQSINELLTATGQFFAQAGPLMSMVPEIKPMAFQMIKMGVRRYRAGRELEAVLTKAMDDHMAAIEAAKNQPPPEPPPDPEMIKAQTQVQVMQMKMEVDQQKAMSKMQVEQMKAEAKIQREQMQAQTEMAQAQANAQTQQAKAEMDFQIKQMKAQMDQQLAAEKLRYEMAIKDQELMMKQQMMQVEAAARIQEANKPEEGGEREVETPPVINVTANIVQPEKKVGTMTMLPDGSKQIVLESV